MQGYIVATDDNYLELTDNSSAKFNLGLVNLSGWDESIIVYTDLNRVIGISSRYDNMYLVDVDDNDIDETHISHITTDRVNVLRKLTNEQIFNIITDPRDALYFARVYPEYRFKLLERITLAYIAVQYVKEFPETKHNLQYLMFGDNVAPYIIIEWIEMFPSDRKLFLGEINSFSLAFKWASRFPEDRAKILKIIKSKSLAVGSDYNMTKWNIRFSK